MGAKRSAAKTAPQKSKIKQDTTAIKGLCTLSLAFAIFFSLLSFSYGSSTPNWIGLVGYTIGKLAHALLGLGSYLLSFYLAWIGWRLLFSKPINHPWIKSFSVFVLIASFCVLLSLVEDELPSIASLLRSLLYANLSEKKSFYHLGGALFYYLYRDIPLVNFLKVFNLMGSLLLFLTTFLASLLFLTKIPPGDIFKALFRLFKAIVSRIKPPQQNSKEEEGFPEDVSSLENSVDRTRFVALRIPGQTSHSSPGKETSSASPLNPSWNANNQELLAIQPEIHLTSRPSLSGKEHSDRNKKEKSRQPEMAQEKAQKNKKKNGLDIDVKAEAHKMPLSDFHAFLLPSPSLLTNAKKIDQSSLKQNLRRQAEVLEETLQSFGIEAKVGQINCGPSITSFEVHPSIGVKVQKIKALENDIALNMEAKSIRIIAPIPGKAAVGIEVPNPQPQEVGFKEMLIAYQQSSKKLHIPILLGKTVSGEYVMSDLTKMPHCIIAGATGSGKSVCINTIVMAILMNARPDEIKLVMIDPKKVELTPYTLLPHMLAPVITEPQGACAALNWLVKEMESRYEILKQLGVRNIEAFNTRTVNKTLEESLEREIPVKLPYIVVIIDELADLMMVASNDIETPIARIAQMARAVGIHLILATQRPSREVITGLIKANFPTRISFKVASRVNSQIILDEVGAESLLGNGDMLFLPPGTSVLTRAQGAFIRDDDIVATVKHICDQAPPNYVIASFDDLGRSETTMANSANNSADNHFDQAVEIVKSSGNASTTFLQRKLKIGYARAASLIDEMEAQGIIGPSEGSKSRRVLQEKETKKLPDNEERDYIYEEMDQKVE